jgi:hypothetical protein
MRKTKSVSRKGASPSDSIPSLIAHVENEVFRVRVDWSGEDFLPVLEVRPGLVGSGTGEGRVAGTGEPERRVSIS